MAGLTGDQIRETFLRFFSERGHLVVPSASLIAPKESGLIFTSAGVDQFLPYMLGHVEPPRRRLASIQKVFRTTDIEAVGDDIHNTFFDMLGNWSIGDYFKAEAVAYAWELSTGGLGLDRDRISVTVHPDDDVTPGLWRQLGLPDERIVTLAKNWWPEAGAIGPCGPDTEMFYDRGEAFGCDRPTCGPDCDCGRFVEFWNVVFMQYNRDAAGNLQPLPKANVDTGMGLDRMAVILQNVRTNYETDRFRPVLDRVATIARLTYGANASHDRSLRIISDHIRGVTFLLADNVRPGNEGRGYVLRRLIRRAVRHGVLLGVTEPFLADLGSVVIRHYSAAYPELSQRAERIRQVLTDEEQRFSATLQVGMATFERLAHDVERRDERVLPGERIFRLYDSQGLPLEVVQELAAERGLSVDVAGFETEMARQVASGKRDYRRRSSGAVGETASRAIATLPPTEFTGYTELETEATVLRLLIDGEAAGAAEPGQRLSVVLDRSPFYVQSGGQVADTGELRAGDALINVEELEKLPSGVVLHTGTLEGGELHEGDAITAYVDQERRAAVRRNHTATHLLHRALRQHLGEHVEQAGSVVAPDHLSFDFTHGSRLSAEELHAVERDINQHIGRNLPVTTVIKLLAEARAEGAMALFGEKYGESVRVVTVEGYSKELCGGTHVGQIGEIGPFFVVAESGIGAGVRRIEAVTGLAAVAYTRRQTQILDDLARQFKAAPTELPQRVQALEHELEELRQKVQSAEREQRRREAERLAGRAVAAGSFRVVAEQVTTDQAAGLRQLADDLLDRLQPAVILLAAPSNGRAQLLAAVSPELTKDGQDAGRLVKELAKRSGGGGGGGNPRMATGSSSVPTGVVAALTALRDELVKG
ncbi:MAG: alanine--tRNA ligase [Chloroflexota bacterium]